MPELTIEELTLALGVVAGVTLIALLLCLVLAARLRRARREYMVIRGDGEERDILQGIGRMIGRVDALEARADALASNQELHAATGRFALQKFGIVRYDAFEDMGGRLSFSAALLDDHGDGVVISSINGRTETRTYAKPIRQLASEHNLSEEEREAIASAMAGYGRATSRAELSR